VTGCICEQKKKKRPWETIRARTTCRSKNICLPATGHTTHNSAPTADATHNWMRQTSTTHFTAASFQELMTNSFQPKLS